MNATLQCLKIIPELNDALKSFTEPIFDRSSAIAPAAQSLTASVRELFNLMENSGQAEVIFFASINFCLSLCLLFLTYFSIL